MSRFPLLARVYIAAVAAAGGVFLLASTTLVHVHFDLKMVITIVFWGAMSATLERFAIPLPRAGSATLSTVPYMALIILLPFPVPMLLGACIILATDILERKPYYKVMLNFGNYVLSFGIPSILWALTSSSPPFSQIPGQAVQQVIAVMAVVVGFYLVNVFVMDGLWTFIERKPLIHIWLVNDRPVMLPTVALEVIGVLAAFTWHYSPIWVILTLVPLAITFSAFQSIRRLEDETKEAIFALADSIDARDPLTFQHSLRVASYATKIAERIGLSFADVEEIQLIARVHDLGKIGTPNQVLFKTGRLDEAEWDAMRKHPEVGAEIVSKYRLFRRGADMVRYHHERYDGHGYPQGKKGKNIPLGARIICVADSFDAMVSDRPYRKGMEVEAAIEELKRCSLTHFDPAVVAVMIEILSEEQDESKIIQFQQPEETREVDKGNVVEMSGEV